MILNKHCFLLAILILFISQNISAHVNFRVINFNQAIKQAQDENKKIIVYLYSIPCPASTLLKYNQFENSSMSKFINSNYVYIKMRGDKTDKNNDLFTLLIKKYKIGRGFPVVHLLKSNGKFIDRIPGFGDKESYWHILKDYTNDMYTYNCYQYKLKINPNDGESMIALAKKYRDRHISDEAFKLFESADKYNSCKNGALTWFVLSGYCDHQGKLSKSIFACEMAMRFDPDNSQFQMSLKKTQAI